jgi:hypothetical protein
VLAGDSVTQAAFRYVLPGTTEFLSYHGPSESNHAAALTADGGTIVGYRYTPATPHTAFLWTPAAGMRDLPVLAGTTASEARAISADGGIIAGLMSLGGNRAAIWRGDGPHQLADLLAPYGVIPPGWVLNEIVAISADGGTMLGNGLNGGVQTPFLVHLPAGCYANCDASSTSPILNVSDFVCFLNRYAAGDSYANCDGSTTPPVLNVSDFTCFLNRYSAGCP